MRTLQSHAQGCPLMGCVYLDSSWCHQKWSDEPHKRTGRPQKTDAEQVIIYSACTEKIRVTAINH
jgi:hypothetical protein